MNNNLIVQISEGLGNQLFMYAHAYALSKNLNKNLLIDNTTGYYKNKNLLRSHQKFMLNFLNISEDYAPSYYRYDTIYRNIYKKLLLFIDNFKSNKSFLTESIIKDDNKKIAINYSLHNLKLNKNIYVSGNFENENYFVNYRNDLMNIFSPKENFINSHSDIISKLKKSNSISIHIRRGRFSDQRGLNNDPENKIKSDNFTNEIVNYINRSIKYISKNVENPEYFIWSNDFKHFDSIAAKINLENYELINTNDPINDFYLFKFVKHFIVGPSSFHWWGAWLNNNSSKICIRPSNLNPSNNENFWPEKWISV